MVPTSLYVDGAQIGVPKNSFGHSKGQALGHFRGEDHHASEEGVDAVVDQVHTFEHAVVEGEASDPGPVVV